jgi:hypothetical protein
VNTLREFFEKRATVRKAYEQKLDMIVSAYAKHERAKILSFQVVAPLRRANVYVPSGWKSTAYAMVSVIERMVYWPMWLVSPIVYRYRPQRTRLNGSFQGMVLKVRTGAETFVSNDAMTPRERVWWNDLQDAKDAKERVE